MKFHFINKFVHKESNIENSDQKYKLKFSWLIKNRFRLSFLLSVILILTLVFITVLSHRVSPAKQLSVCVYYYGFFNSSIRQRLLTTRPRFVVLDTPGGSYKDITAPTPSDIAELKTAGIKVLSYISTGDLVGFRFAEDSPPNDREYVRSCIESVAAEGCSGIYFDEGGVGYHPSHADRYYVAPETDIYGNPNSWAGYTIEDYASYTHSFGLIAVEGTDFRDSQYLNPNIFDIFDYVLTDEHYTPREPEGSEIGHENRCWVIGQGTNNPETAVKYTNDALSRGFGASYQCSTIQRLDSWYESFISLLNSTFNMEP
jgi:hypothetical protein